jgi:shikimate kinase
MEKQIFVLGLPGSGKSTGVRLIEGIAHDMRWFPSRFNDYDVLQEMYRRDDGEKFSPAAHDGFDVHDHQVFDVALQHLEKNVRSRSIMQDRKELVIIEFSRNDYRRAFKLFSRSFLHDSLFLFIDAEVETCIERIRNRSDNPVYPDDHYVSEYIFESYYHKDDRQDALTLLQASYGIDRNDATVIYNPAQKSLQDFCHEIETWITPVLQKTERATKSSRV